MARPTKLTDDIQKQIIDLIRAGNYIETASACAGIHKDTLYEWLKRGAREKQKGGKIDKNEAKYVMFSDAVQKAIAEAEARDVMNILKASQTDWKASAWRLERKFPNKWGRKEHITAEVTQENVEKTETYITHQIESDPETIELVRQLWRRKQALGEQLQHD